LDPYTVSVQGIDSVETCEFGRSLLYCDFEGSGSISWFNTESGGVKLEDGSYYLTPALSFEQTYYAEVRASEFGGKDTFDLNQMDIGDNDGFLAFNCSEPFFLKSVTVYAEAVGPRIFTLTDAGETWSIDKFITVEHIGEQRIILEMEVPAENNLRFGITAGQSLRFSTDADYPYDLAGVGTIFSSVGSPNPSEIYYGFYDWEIQKFEACERIPVVATVVEVDQAPEAMFSPSETTIDLADGGGIVFTDASTDATSWYWDFGDGTNSNEQNPNHTYTEVGIYIVTLTGIGAEGCSDSNVETVVVTDDQLVNVVSPGDLTGQVLLYPNPTSDLLRIAFNLEKSHDVGIEVYDVFGQLLRIMSPARYYQDQITLEMGEFPAGLYYVVFNTEGVKTPFKVVVD